MSYWLIGLVVAYNSDMQTVCHLIAYLPSSCQLLGYYDVMKRSIISSTIIQTSPGIINNGMHRISTPIAAAIFVIPLQKMYGNETQRFESGSKKKKRKKLLEKKRQRW